MPGSDAVEPCNEVFSPSAAELDMARRVIAAFDEAKPQGDGVATVDGRMIENLHVESAKRAVAMGEGSHAPSLRHRRGRPRILFAPLPGIASV
jgi:citrate lyase beta subunit